MSAFTQFLGGGGGGVIAGVTAETGETFSVGDPVALNYRGRAIKTAAASGPLQASTPAKNTTLLATIEVAMDVFCFFVYNNGTTTATLVFYNRATHSVIASPTISIAGGCNFIDARTLPSGDVAILFNNNTNVYLTKFSAAGSQVYAPVNVGACASFNGSGAYNIICPSPNSGEVAVLCVTTTPFVYMSFYNTSGTYTGVSATSAAMSPTGGTPFYTAQGNGQIAVAFSNTSNGAFYTVNATTRAVVADAQCGFAVTGVAGIFYDATNTLFGAWCKNGSTYGVLMKCSAAGAVTYSYWVDSQFAASSTYGTPSATSCFGNGGPFLYVYSTSGGGTVNSLRMTAPAFSASVASLTPQNVQNYGYANGYGSGSGYSTPYGTVADGVVGTAAFTINATTGALTPLFSWATNSNQTGVAPAKRAQRYTVSAAMEQTPASGLGYAALTVRRADAGILYGIVKKVSGSLVDIDTTALHANSDSYLTPVRSRQVAIANGVEYFLPG